MKKYQVSLARNPDGAVVVTVTLPADMVKSLEARVRPLGMDPIALIESEYGDTSSVESLLDDQHYLFGSWTFPDRAAAQRAVNAYYKGRRVNCWSRQEVSFMTPRGEFMDTLYAPGARQAERKKTRLMGLAKKGGKAAERAKAELVAMTGLQLA